jgi:hypothetical protein
MPIDPGNAANGATALIAKGNQLLLGGTLNNGFFEPLEFELIDSGGTIYAEVWSAANTYNAGTTYNRGDQTIYSNVRYFCLTDSNTGNQPDISPTNWEAIINADFNLHGYIDGTSTVYTLDTTTGPGVSGHARIALTTGTDTVPVNQYIWAELDGSTSLQLATGTSLPADPIIVIGQCSIPSLATFQSSGAYSQQRHTNAVYRESPYYQGLINAIANNIRNSGATWVGGVDATLTITVNGGAIDNAILTTLIGNVNQLWEQSFPAFSGTPKLYIVNHPVTPWLEITDLNAVDVEANNVTLRNNNDRYGLEIIGIQSSGTNSIDRLGVILPNGKYSTDAGAIDDVQNLSITSIPADINGTAFRICRVVLKYQTLASGTILNLMSGTAVQDRRGFPFGGVGGGAGSSVTTEFSDADFEVYNAADTTKRRALDASAITTATTRTVTIQDNNGIEALLAALLTQGSIPFADANGLLAQDNAKWFWDNTLKALGIGTNSINTSAILDLDSTTQAALFTRMTTTQRDALTAVNGMTLYNSTLQQRQDFIGGSWRGFPRYSYLDLNGSDETAYAADSASLSITGDMTFELFFIIRALSTNHYLFNKLSGTASGFGMYISSAGAVVFSNSDGTLGNSILPNGTVTVDQAIRLKGAYDASAGTCSWYVDRISTASTDTLRTSMTDNAISLYLGSAGGTSNWSNVQLMLVAIADNLQDNGDSLDPNDANTVFYHTFDGILTDLSASGNDLTGVLLDQTNYGAYD